MARHHLAATGAAPPASAALEGYLAELAGRLHGPRRRRDAVLAEIRDGLAEATADNTARGMSPVTAAAAAVDEFGTPVAVADAFAGELTTAYARRTIAAFVLTGPVVGVWWLLLLGPRPWRFDLLAIVAAIPALPVVALAVATAVATLATTGRLMRWLPETTPARALTAVAAVAGCCLAGDLTVLGILAARAASGGALPPVLATIAATASLIRIAAATTTLRHTRHFRHTPQESAAARP